MRRINLKDDSARVQNFPQRFPVKLTRSNFPRQILSVEILCPQISVFIKKQFKTIFKCFSSFQYLKLCYIRLNLKSTFFKSSSLKKCNQHEKLWDQLFVLVKLFIKNYLFNRFAAHPIFQLLLKFVKTYTLQLFNNSYFSFFIN